jgi:hypothetical protein
MAADKPGKRKLVDRVDDEEDSKKANQTFQLHTLGFTFSALLFAWQQGQDFTQFFKGRQR